MLDTQAPQTNLLRVGEVLDRTRVSKATLYRMVKKKQFPAPISLGSTYVWDEGEINRHIEKLKAAR